MFTPLVRPVVQPVFAKVAGAYQAVGGGASFPPKEFYFTDFAGVADGTNLVNLEGWDAYNTTGIVTPDPTGAVANRWQIVSNSLTWVGGADFTTRPGPFFVGRDVGSTNLVFRVKLNALPNSGAALILPVASTNVNNSIYLNCVNSSGTMGSIDIRRNNGGSDSVIGTVTAIGNQIVAGDTVEIRVFGNNLWVFVNGLLPQGANPSGVNISVHTKGTLCGFGTRNTVGAVFDDVYIAPLTSATLVASTQIFWPATFEDNGTDAAFSGTYLGDLQALDYRVINATTAETVKPWARVSGASIAGGTWSGNVFLPMCDTAVNPKVMVEFKAANDTDATCITAPTAVGIVVASYGQSNSALRGNEFSTNSVFTNGYQWAATAGSEWRGGIAASGSRVAQWAQLMATVIGVPVGVQVDGEGSRSIEMLSNASGAEWLQLISRTTASKAYGKIIAWLWTQGENEANGTGLLTSTDENDYRNSFDTLLSLLRTGGASANASVPVGVVVIGTRTGTHAGGATIGDANWSFMRRVLSQLGDKPSTYIASSAFDAALADELHYTPDAFDENGRRSAYSMLESLGYTVPYNGRGPLITGATRSGATITLAVNLNGASSISGTGLTNYEVSTDDFATTRTISSVAVSGGNIVITLAADPGAAVKVRSFYGMTYGTPTLAIGSYSDGTTIPVEPIYAPITSN